MIVTPPVGEAARMRLSSDFLTVSIRDRTDRMSFTSHLRHPSVTGFTSNQRPAVYYKPSLDRTDNPRLGLLLSDSFTSQTKLHYRPHVSSDRSGSLPSLINKPRDSGFRQLRHLSKTPSVEDKTEYQRMFLHLTPSVSLKHVTVGPKTESGFTKRSDAPQQKHCSWTELRQTSTSVMKSDFLLPSLLQGTKIPSLSNPSCGETGFTRGAFAPTSHPSSLLPSNQTRRSTQTIKIIGKKEATGFLSNAPKNEAFPKTPFDPAHLTTHYRSKFCHPADVRQQSSNPTAGIMTAKMDRFQSSGF